MRILPAAHVAVSSLLLTTLCSADAVAPSQSSVPSSPGSAALSGNQIVQILDQTVDWYRTLGTQQQSTNEPSDLLIYYANEQVANQVVALAFDIARANAELLSSEASTESAADNNPSSWQALDTLNTRLQAQRQSIQAEMVARKQQLFAARSGSTADLQAKLAELQGEADMINARLNLLDNMRQFVAASNSKTASVNALKAHIDAIAASIPTSAAPKVAVMAPAAITAGKPTAPAQPAAPATNDLDTIGRSGIWDLGTRVLGLHAKVGTINAIDQRTVELEKTFQSASTPPLVGLKALTAQSDALARQADAAGGATLHSIRDQLDTLAWLFQQNSAIWIPLNKEAVLLEQYRHNLRDWREAVRHEYGNTLKQLGARTAVLMGMLIVVFAGTEVWRRLVIRYTQEPRRRYQLLLFQRLTLWTLVTLIVALTFVTQISAFATFAGLITAGLAVAMQSILLSIVGYFFLIGKYGLRIGDRIQIGNVTGEVISLGLVRLHLLELSTQGVLGASGRLVGFANSIVFQSANGLFRQIPGVDFIWHEVTIGLPSGSDYSAIRAKLLSALSEVVGENHAEFMRQAEQIGKATASTSVVRPTPQVQLRFAASGVEALIRYPAQWRNEAETEERVSRAILEVLATA